MPYVADPVLYGYLETVGSVMAFTCATTALLRFRGTNDRIALLLALAFVASGLIETVFGLTFYQRWAEGSGGLAAEPLEWMAARTFLAAVLMVGLLIEHRLPQSRRTGREVLSAVVLVVAVAYLTAMFYVSAGFFNLPLAEVHFHGSILPRPGHLLPAGLFLWAAIKCQKRLKIANSLFDHALCAMAGLSVVTHFLASQAGDQMDAPLVFAQFLKVASYTVLLGGALLDHVRLFDQVRRLAASDPLTGLANYRRFNDAMSAEMRRSQRTGRPFAILLLDLDGLKKINDKLGHDVGSRAICRLADVLKAHCRSMDTASRFGGDEFALVLPETDHTAASRVSQRIREFLTADGQEPPLTVSIGVAVYPRHGATLDALQRAADQELYAMKRSLRRKRKTTRAANAA